MALTAEEVRRIAALARLELADDELERTARELDAVLEFVSQLRRLDLSEGDAGGRVAPGAALREDAIDASRCLDPEVATAMAPEAEDGFFLVPPIVENVNP